MPCECHIFLTRARFTPEALNLVDGEQILHARTHAHTTDICNAGAEQVVDVACACRLLDLLAEHYGGKGGQRDDSSTNVGWG